MLCTNSKHPDYLAMCKTILLLLLSLWLDPHVLMCNCCRHIVLTSYPDTLCTVAQDIRSLHILITTIIELSRGPQAFRSIMELLGLAKCVRVPSARNHCLHWDLQPMGI